ncbi:Uncharacterised protein [Candidatus Tiddalikarchaeum anstoanum]|nr:Uncharacterised protein [Candidatus Tiddalikarchaeum anstoanum]
MSDEDLLNFTEQSPQPKDDLSSLAQQSPRQKPVLETLIEIIKKRWIIISVAIAVIIISIVLIIVLSGNNNGAGNNIFSSNPILLDYERTENCSRLEISQNQVSNTGCSPISNFIVRLNNEILNISLNTPIAPSETRTIDYSERNNLEQNNSEILNASQPESYEIITITDPELIANITEESNETAGNETIETLPEQGNIDDCINQADDIFHIRVFNNETSQCQNVQLTPTTILEEHFSSLSNWNINYGNNTYGVDNGMLVCNVMDQETPLLVSVLNISNMNYYFKGDFNIQKGFLILFTRIGQDNNAYILIIGENYAELMKVSNTTNSGMIYTSTPQISLNNWNNFEIVNYNNIIRVFINGGRIIDYTDTAEPLTSGNLGLLTTRMYNTTTYDRIMISIKDIEISELT